MTDGWIDQFADLSELPPQDQAILTGAAVPVSLPAGTTVFAPGVEAESFVLVLDGTIRVQQVGPNGREIVLYRVTGGETCIMTSACLLSDEAYKAEGVTETAVEAIAIPKAAFDAAMARSPGFRRLIFSDYSHRISDLMSVVEEVAFERLDKRLAHHLLVLAGAGDIVTATHQDLAAEIGTAREVVGRQLGELQRRGWVALSRGQITLIDRTRLAALAEAE